MAARAELPELTEDETREALERLDPLWDELFPAEQARIIRLLVERVEIGPDGCGHPSAHCRPDQPGARSGRRPR